MIMIDDGEDDDNPATVRSNSHHEPTPESTYSNKLNRPAVHYEVALSIPSKRIFVVAETTDSSTSVVTHTSSLAAAAAVTDVVVADTTFAV